jgi:hypothetical protein
MMDEKRVSYPPTIHLSWVWRMKKWFPIHSPSILYGY